MLIDLRHQRFLLLRFDQKHAAFFQFQLAEQTLRDLRLDIEQRVAHSEYVVSHSRSFTLRPGVADRAILLFFYFWAWLCENPTPLSLPDSPLLQPGIFHGNIERKGDKLLRLRVSGAHFGMLFDGDDGLPAFPRDLLHRRLLMDRFHLRIGPPCVLFELRAALIENGFALPLHFAHIALTIDDRIVGGIARHGSFHIFGSDRRIVFAIACRDLRPRIRANARRAYQRAITSHRYVDRTQSAHTLSSL